MNFVSDYIKALRAELLKLKGAGMLWLVLAMSAFIPAIFTLAGLIREESSITSVNTVNPWKQLAISCFNGFGIFFFPIFLTLVIIRLTQMEHRGGGWKLIETQPISKLSLYLGKFSVGILVSFLCIISLILFTMLSGLIIMLAKSGAGYSDASVPIGFILTLGLRLLIAGLGVLGIQYFFSVNISGFIGPFGIGLAATITGMILLGFGKAFWWPYLAPGLTVNNAEGSATGNFLLFYEKLSIAWMTLALVLGFQWYERKTLIRAFFKPIRRVLFAIIPIAIFMVLFVYINKPVQLPRHSRTVITGVLDSKENIRTAYLFAEPFYDTVLKIPVNNNRFSFQTDEDIAEGTYYFKAGSLNPVAVFFGDKDSLHISISSDGKSQKVTLSGNRIAENQNPTARGPENGYSLYYLENFGYELKPDRFAREIMSSWRKDISQIEDFKTADNLKPGDDFTTLRKKLTALRYIKIIDIKYPQWFRIYHPNEKLNLPESLGAIRNTVSENESNLLRYEQYRDFITDYYEQKFKLSLSNDTAYIASACRVIEPGATRDFIVYNKLKEAVGRTRDSVRREMLVTNYLASISQKNLQQNISSQLRLLNSLNRGKPAPDFLTTALNKDTFSLKEFKGRYVAIDVWATWCAPCKIESPNFERLAEQYTSPNIAFIALSVDDNKWMWENEAREKSPRVLQLIANDKNVIGKSYGLEYIPRFILIGPEGKIINAQMPNPSDPLFEDVLRKEVPGLAGL